MEIRKLRLEIVVGFVTAAALLYIFADLAEGLLADELTGFDAFVTGYIRAYISPTITAIALFFTTLGTFYADVLVLVVICIYLLVFRKQKLESVILIITLAGAAGLNVLLKDIFKRSRPDIARLAEAGGYSFPSGHAMISAAFYGMIGYMLWRSLRQQGRSAWHIAVLTGVFVLLIGVSRIYLGVHYPSDVLAGFAAGGVWLLACIAGLHAFRRKQSPDLPGGRNDRFIRR